MATIALGPGLLVGTVRVIYRVGGVGTAICIRVGDFGFHRTVCIEGIGTRSAIGMNPTIASLVTNGVIAGGRNVSPSIINLGAVVEEGLIGIVVLGGNRAVAIVGILAIGSVCVMAVSATAAVGIEVIFGSETIRCPIIRVIGFHTINVIAFFVIVAIGIVGVGVVAAVGVVEYSIIRAICAVVVEGAARTVVRAADLLVGAV